GTSSEARPRRGVSAARGKPVGRVTPMQVDQPPLEEEPEPEDVVGVADYDEAEEEVEESGRRMDSPNGKARQPSQAKWPLPSAALDRVVVAAACACEGGNGQPPQFVFALGTLGIHFGTEVRRDYFLSTFGDRIRTILDPQGEGLFELISEILAIDVDARQPGTTPPVTVTVTQAVRSNQYLAEKFIWTLNHDATPIYAI